jgi:SPX domain protein involved in polyphosphate accumulation
MPSSPTGISITVPSSNAVDYEKLKNLLKTDTKGYTELSEQAFITALEAELDKVYTFSSTKAEELTHRVKFQEAAMEKMFALKRVDGEMRLATEEELDRITSEVNELASFIRLNYSVFLKVCTLIFAALKAIIHAEGTNYSSDQKPSAINNFISN